MWPLKVSVLSSLLASRAMLTFLGRIHFSIYYPDLDFEARRAIWKTFILKTQGSKLEISDEDIDRLAKYKMNGRQVDYFSFLFSFISCAQGV